MQMANLEKQIARSALFQGLSESDLGRLAGICSPKTVGKGKLVVVEGQAASGFYLVAKGQVKVFKSSSEGREKILHVFGPGESFGEVTVFCGKPYPASVMAMENSTLLLVPRKRFVELVEGDPSLSLNMMANLALKLRRFSSQIEDLALREVPARIASHLLFLSESQGGAETVILGMPKGQLANLLGTTPETLSRVFTSLGNSGLVRAEGRSVHLLDLPGLRKAAKP
ncbi:Crp/Fnr family transcriptional regulator [Pelagicoccus sp. SDUM812003]|uniref:Crp/Fnr family transcriptional regulator n=1 Tax=Pelagicoccus sp. SDUM812003 TaxID=3041267 RepID=UPI00280F6C28|nr:Crp/Fnr family transcriptional regulator [Pelagicoccus sp. SDUM812003]MDQ8202592.1 Crp/Fnr family transcriptional regulator [Pelagicoccus sp. SDUM812003]